jgi:hypothetical protein
MRVTADDVRALLASDEPGARLVLHEGRLRVLGERDLRSPDHAGAVEVAERDELREELPDEATPDDYERVAAGLDVTLSNQGG